jgi:hypothetical protein
MIADDRGLVAAIRSAVDSIPVPPPPTLRLSAHPARHLQAVAFVCLALVIALGAAQLINTVHTGRSTALVPGDTSATSAAGSVAFGQPDVSLLPRLHAAVPTVLLLATPEDVTLLESFAEYGLPHGPFIRDRLPFDLDREVAVVVLGGVRPCVGPNLTIEQVSVTSSGLSVSVREPARDPRELCLDSVTYPSAIAVISRGRLSAQPGLTIDAAWTDGIRRATTYYCGSEKRAQGAVALGTADRCRNATPAAAATQLAVAAPTIEGDTVVTAALMYPSAASYVALDRSADRFSAPGDRRIWTYRCGQLPAFTRPPGSGQIATGCTGDGAEVLIP